MNKLPQNDWEKELNLSILRYAVFVGTAGAEHYRKNILMKEIKAQISKAKKKTAKAFSGCEKCFGKGWASQRRGMHGAEDFGGDGFEVAPREEMNFCSCQRGKDLKKYFEREKKEGWNEGWEEAIEKISIFVLNNHHTNADDVRKSITRKLNSL